MSARWGDRLAEPCEWTEPSDNLPWWLHLLIWLAVIGILWAASWALQVFEPAGWRLQ
jgi:hypothetical protein